MPPEAARGVHGLFARYRGLIFPMLIVASVLVIVAPLPPLLLDLLLAGNITVAVVILLTTIYVNRPLEFSVFPAILLGTTLSRLVLNVASTRLILSHGAGPGLGIPRAPRVSQQAVRVHKAVDPQSCRHQEAGRPEGEKDSDGRLPADGRPLDPGPAPA